MTTRRTLAALLGVALLLSACSSGSKVRALPAGVRPGGHATIGILSPRSIAPWLTSTLDPYGTLVVTTMCDQVLGLDPESGELTSVMATSIRWQSANNLVVKVRKGLRFPDGSSVSVGDIIESVSRAAKSEIASPVADVVKIISGSELLGGLQTTQELDPKLRDRLAGFVSPDPGVIEVHLAAPAPDRFRLLAHPLASVVSSKAFNKDPAALERNPGCVGPYRLSEPWQPGATAIHLVRSEVYDANIDAYTAGGRGLLDSIDFRIYPDREALYGAYRAGEVDLAYLPATKLEEARRALDGDVIEAASPTVEYIGLPTTKPPFDKPEVRVALSAALDREALVRSLVAPLRPLGRFLPPTLGDAYTDNEKVYCRVTAKPTADMETARRALADANVNLAGSSFKVVFNDEFDNRALVEAVAKQWEAAFGLRVELVPTPWEKILDGANSTGGLPDPFRFSWSPEVSDPTEYMRPLFHSASLQQGNWSRMTVRRFDFQLDEEANKKTEPADRATELLAAETVLCGSMPMIPVAQGGFAYAIRQQRLGAASGRFTDRVTGAPLLRELYVKAQ